ncbi:MAG: sulfatase-like hydrolase/transferase [Phycisphaerae bacterium]|nr:sulfatase [Phycisphaerae bacterium]NIP53206.1 sulfatase [Phycisphaerae bacterium]NIS52241.1 sulfatase [Phycisphaerae bacterium]NIU09767.1 sulfatase [Phycisphaerae bacterium]NIU59187.1 sulfatase-like hydrolase/transferase [Phycisphaerae bacterium]
MNTSNYTRRDFLKAVSLGTASLGLPRVLLAAEKGQSKKPNVLFIAVDDLRPQLGCYGHKQMLSPNIDRLASDGVLFTRSYCQVPVCGASRASLLTGVRPTRDRFINYSVWAEKDLPGALSLPKHFKNNGYHTISNGKVFHHSNDCRDSWSEDPWRPKGPWQNYLLEESRKLASKNQRGKGPAFESADVPDNAYFDGMIADKAISDLKRLADMDKPFFLALGFFKPHLPFNAPKKYWDLYKREKIDLADNPFRPKGAPDAALHNWGELRAYIGIPPKGSLSDELARTLIHGYYACVSYTDAQIGRVLSELDRLGLRKNTIVVLWGDHGWNLGEHGLWCKHCNFETSLHSPLIVTAPGIKAGQKTNALTEYLDIYPSLCQLCNLPLPAHLHGKSFVPLMKNPNMPWKEAVFSRYYNGDSIKTDRYRYTEWRRKNDTIYARMLYDHKTDPHENVNISELPENKEIVVKLSKILGGLRK